MAVDAGGHPPHPEQSLELTPNPEPLAGMQRAVFHQQPADSGHAPLGPAADQQHGGLHLPLPPCEHSERPSAPAAGTAAGP